jgi:hypothetical protein
MGSTGLAVVDWVEKRTDERQKRGSTEVGPDIVYMSE